MDAHEDLSEEIPKIIQDPTTGTQYSRGELLGSGGFGKCYLFIDLSTREKYAGKVIMKSRLKGSLSMAYEETSIQMNLRHPNILKMFRFFYLPTYVCMTLELCDDTLKNILRWLEVLDEPSCRFVTREVACGISHLHEKRIIHRDIKPGNIFFTKHMDVKIGDFGIAIKNVDPVSKIMKACGTAKYFAPETLNGSGYSFGVDVWALGITLYKMAVGRFPFDYGDDHMLYVAILRHEYSIPSTVPTHTEEVIRILLTRDPDSRPVIDDVLKKDYLSSGSISKDHLLEYISGKPSSRTTGQKDSRECYAVPFGRRENIPKEDCKLDVNYGIENIFQKGFRIRRRHSKSRIVGKLGFDSTPGNENISEEELKLDVGEKSSFSFKGIHTFVGLFFENGLKGVTSSMMDRNALFCSSRPKHYISKWIDFNKRYGLGYQLSDSSVGVNFKDNSRLVVDGTMDNYQYIGKDGAREYFERNKCPTKLDKKLKLLEYFKRYMESNLVGKPPVEEQENIKIFDKGIPILLKWKRNDKCICFILLNGVFQINFLEDHTKIIIAVPTKSISIIDKDNKLKTYSHGVLINGGMDDFIKKKMSYIKEVVDQWTSLKRRHEGDDDVTPAKKSNNN
uniref:Serine/threonine-protein kinase PLK n=1 Tax=Strongyloides papillosus TaxID=174720 RepID=A0A0N5BJ84_STREA